jgi:O-antigen ligase
LTNYFNSKKYLDINKFFELLIVIVPISIFIGNFALNLNILLIDLLFLYFLFSKKILIKKNVLKFGLFLLMLFIVNIGFSVDLFLSIKGSLGILKYSIFFLAFAYFLESETNNKAFFRLIFFIILFVVIDTLIQYLFGSDIFGYELSTAHGKRLSGPFGDEYVVGAYLSKLIFVGIIYLIQIKKNEYFNYYYLGVLLAIIFLTQERSAFFISLISSIFFILLYNSAIKHKIIFLVMIITCISLFLKFDNYSYNKYFKTTLQQLGINKEIHHKSNEDKIVISTFWDSRYGAHFLTAYEIYLDNKVFGSGIKTFRKVCALSKYEKIESKYREQRCNTHPHNIYFEILAEGGFLLFIPFCLLILFLVIKNFVSFFKEDSKNLYLVNLGILIVLFFPVQTTGSFFSTFNGVFYWLGLAIISCNMKLSFFRKSF